MCHVLLLSNAIIYFMRIAIQGTAGAFHEFAARKWAGDIPIDFVYCDTFRAVFKALDEGKADKAVSAIENSLYGSINDVYDLLQKYHFAITGEIMLHIHQQLIGFPGASLKDITEVYSQDVALAQCEDFLAAKLSNATPFEHHDTAASVELVKNKGDAKLAAIASRFSAHYYGLPILAENIEDNPQNYTRFVVLEKNTRSTPGADKTSIILTTDHTPGALYRALGVFAHYGVNLTAAHSRPIPEKAWRHKFYLDVDVTGDILQAAVTTLKEQGASVTILGQYKHAITTFDT
jgi:prephenate dehydratase